MGYLSPRLMTRSVEWAPELRQLHLERGVSRSRELPSSDDRGVPSCRHWARRRIRPAQAGVEGDAQ